MVQALHSDTHFFLHGQSDHCKTRLGTRPGDSWADIIFSFLWSRLLHDLEGDLQHLGLLEEVPAEQGLRNPKLPCTLESPTTEDRINFLGPTWMDDSAFCFAAPSAELLEQKAGQLCGLLLQKCQEFAMTPNLAPGKTAVMLIFQGRGAKAARVRHFGPHARRRLPVITDCGVQQVHLVTSYTHLGCLLHHKGDMRHEARRRFSIAQQAFQHHRISIKTSTYRSDGVQNSVKL